MTDVSEAEGMFLGRMRQGEPKNGFGLPLQAFVEQYGVFAFASVLNASGDDIGIATQLIQEDFACCTNDLGGFVRSRLFDIVSGVLDNSEWGLLPQFVDCDGLAEAMVNSGRIRAIPFDGKYLYFDQSRAWRD